MNPLCLPFCTQNREEPFFCASRLVHILMRTRQGTTGSSHLLHFPAMRRGRCPRRPAVSVRCCFQRAAARMYCLCKMSAGTAIHACRCAERSVRGAATDESANVIGPMWASAPTNVQIKIHQAFLQDAPSVYFPCVGHAYVHASARKTHPFRIIPVFLSRTVLNMPQGTMPTSSRRIRTMLFPTCRSADVLSLQNVRKT